MNCDCSGNDRESGGSRDQRDGDMMVVRSGESFHGEYGDDRDDGRKSGNDDGEEFGNGGDVVDSLVIINMMVNSLVMVYMMVKSL